MYYKKEISWWNKIFIKQDNIKKDDNTLTNQINHFSDVILKKVKPKVDGKDGLISLKILDAIRQSSRNGKKIKI